MRYLALNDTPKSNLDFVDFLLSVRDDAPEATEFFKKILLEFSERLRSYHNPSDSEFRAMIALASKLGLLGVAQAEVARRLVVTPMTLQRWARGQNLPNLLPRNAYLSEIARFADEIVKKLTEEQGSGLRHDRLAIRTVDKAKVVRLRDLAEA